MEEKAIKHIFFVPVLSLLLLQGCSSTSYVGPGLEVEPKAVQNILNGRKVWVDLHSGEELIGFVIRTTTDSLWLNVDTAECIVPQQSIREIVVFESGTWLLPGAIVGGVTFTAIGYASGPWPGAFSGEFPKKSTALLIGFGGMITGAIVGSILNPRIGYSYLPWDTTYVIRDEISLEDILVVTLDRVLVDGPTYFTGTIGEREYRFDKAEAAYWWRKTSSGVSYSVKGRRKMFLRLGVPGAR